MSECLKAEGLTKTFGAITALDGANICLQAGRIVGLLGPNGSGKTTLIKLINGLITPTAGTITVCGHAPGVESKRVVAYLPDQVYLNSWMTVRRLLDYFCDFYPDFRREAACEMLARLGIDENRALKTLSKGNKEKVCLILTMARKASLYVLDEPIAGVDPATRDYVISTILSNYDPTSTVLISTHLIADIESVLDEVIFIDRGRIVLQAEVDALRAERGKSVDEVFREVFRW